MLDQVLSLFNINSHTDLDLMQRGQTLPELTAHVCRRMTEVLTRERPDCVLIQGDTTTVMATAVAAFYERIPIGHVEAGLRTYNRYSPFPEEINRRLVSVLAAWHSAPTQAAVHALRFENIPAERIFLTGTTVVDALLWVAARSPSAETIALFDKMGLSVCSPNTAPSAGSGGNCRLLLVTAHRRENFGPPFESLCCGLRAIVERNPDVQLIYPVHLNPNVRDPVHRILGSHERIFLIEPVSYDTFVHLMKAADVILTDSGGIQEEAPVLGKPVLVMRQQTERPEAVEAGTAKIIGTDSDRIVGETETLLRDRDAYVRSSRVGSPYGDGRAAERIVQILLDHYA